jgi:hypothetical protein
MATTATAAAAAAAARARREVREHFDGNNAFDPAHAIAYDPPSRMHRRQFDALIGRGIVLATGDGRYWLDLEAARREDERRRAAAKLVLKILLIAVAISVAGVAIVSALH